MRCKEHFVIDTASRKVRCTLAEDHKGYHEYGTTVWTHENRSPRVNRVIQKPSSAA